MQEYRKTDKHTEWRKKYYDEVSSTKAKVAFFKKYPLDNTE
jgi:hypothetical protein